MSHSFRADCDCLFCKSLRCHLEDGGSHKFSDKFVTTVLDLPVDQLIGIKTDLDIYGTGILRKTRNGIKHVNLRDYLIVKADEPLDVADPGPRSFTLPGGTVVLADTPHGPYELPGRTKRGLTGHDVFKPGKPLPPLFVEEADTIPGHPEVDAPFVDGKYVPAPTQHPDVGVGGFNQAINPKDAAGSKKVAFRYILWAPLILVMRALKNGAQKYGPFNWRTGPKISRVTYVEAAIRHLAADLDGETIDPESGELRTPHIAAAIAGLMVALDAESVGQLEDDRGTPGNVADMIRAETKQ